MQTVGIRELKARTSEILRQVRDEGQPVDITLRGEVIARIVPVAPAQAQHAQALAVLHAMEQLAAEIGAQDLPPIDTTTLMREERREL
jgi:prevent-host-death family protein